jgi:hypothetical protein
MDDAVTVLASLEDEVCHDHSRICVRDVDAEALSQPRRHLAPAAYGIDSPILLAMELGIAEQTLSRLQVIRSTGRFTPATADKNPTLLESDKTFVRRRLRTLVGFF